MRRKACWQTLARAWSPPKAILARSSRSRSRADPEYDQLAADFADWWVELRTLIALPSWRRSRPPAFAPGRPSPAPMSAPSARPGVADFDDLIAWTRRLVRAARDGRVGPLQARPADRPYPGRRGAGHQSPTNGQSSMRSPGEYFSGNPEAEDRWRTLFMVGDYKQAIFGFQGTDPKEFEQFRATCRPSARANWSTPPTRPKFEHASFATCRSTPASAPRRRCWSWSMR